MTPASSATLTVAGSGTFWERLRPVLSGLQVKFTLLVVGLALAVGAMIGTVTVDFSSLLVSRLHRDHCTQTAALVAAKAVSHYAEGEAALHELANELVRTEPFLFVSFMDAEGRLLTLKQGHHGLLAQRTIDGFTPGTPIGDPRLVSLPGTENVYLDVTYPVLRGVSGGAGQVGGEHTVLVGYVRIGYSLERTLNEASSTLDMLTGIAIIVAALTVPLAFLLVRRIVRPLRDLSATMARFADGDHSARVPLNRTDEIGELAGAYNQMADKLTRQHQEILELNAELEERVQQRTSQLRELAARDPLTGLYNRRHFNEVLERRFAEAQRYATQLSCLMLDLDNFKSVNDRFGHQIGDELLILTAITITSALRAADVAARYGGDEFIILLPQTDTPHARILAQRIMAQLNEGYNEQFPQCGVSVSVGIGCMIDVTSQDAEDLIRAADRALYDAKTGGKNTIAARQVLA